MKLTKEDIVRVEDDEPLELFSQGIKSKETLDKYTRMLRQVTCKVLEDVLEGDFEERVQQMVNIGREDPKWLRDLLMNMSRKLRERTELPKGDKDYLNPDSIGNYFKPIKKLLDMNDVSLHWRRIYATYPERDNVPDSRGWTREEIAKMLRYTHGPMERALVLVLASSGIRAGGLDLHWEDLTPIYRMKDGSLVLDPGSDDSRVACAVLHVYRGTSESYMAFITPEAFEAMQEYGRKWAELRGHLPGPKEPIFLVQKGAPKNASSKILRDRVARMAAGAGLRGAKQSKRFEVPIMNGFRRFWNKTVKETGSGESSLASLIRKEYMMGHRGLVALDQNYFKTNLMELAIEYVKAVPDLTIDDSERLRRSNRRMADNIRKMESEKDQKMARMEKEMARMEKEMGELRRNRGLPGSDLVAALKEAAGAEGVPGPVIESLAGMMRQLGAVQEAALKEIRDENDAKMDRLLSVIEKAVKEGDLKRDLLAEFKKAATAKDEPPDANPRHRDPRDSGLC